MGQHAGGGGYTICGPGLELNYRALPDTPLSLTVPLTSVGGNVPSASGFGDVLVGIKRRLAHETNGWPQISLSPQVRLPTGDAARGLGDGTGSMTARFWRSNSATCGKCH
jgi:hypothetical protein